MEELYKDLLTSKAKDYANAYRDAKTVAYRLADWARVNLPERVSSAVWITAQGDDDKGIHVEIKEVPLGKRMKLRLGALIGAWSAGGSATVPIGEFNGIAVSAGAGLVVRYDQLKDVLPIAVLTFRF